VTESNIFRKVDWTSRVECMISLVGGCNSNGSFPVGTPEKHVYAASCRITEYLMARLQAALTMAAAHMLYGMLKRTLCSTLPLILNQTKADLNSYCRYEATMVLII
jgi:hypothetical protein